MSLLRHRSQRREEPLARGGAEQVPPFRSGHLRLAGPRAVEQVPEHLGLVRAAVGVREEAQEASVVPDRDRGDGQRLGGLRRRAPHRPIDEHKPARA
jgi:hypothetical protein